MMKERAFGEEEVRREMYHAPRWLHTTLADACRLLLLWGRSLLLFEVDDVTSR